MNIEERKLSFIKEFLLLEDLEVLGDLEKAIEAYKDQTIYSSIKPMSLEKFSTDINQSISDAEKGLVISAEELQTKIKKWS